jgi:hypothetical protein
VNEIIFNTLGVILLIGCVSIAAMFFVRYKQASQLGERIKPLSPDDRLRVSLALNSLEQAERELMKAAWRDNLPGHLQVGDLLHDTHRLYNRCLRLLKES